MAPQDIFKQTHVPKHGIKEVPNKVNVEQHCADEVLLKSPDVTAGYRHQAPWTVTTRDTRCAAKDRTFDKIIAGAVQREKVEMDRERKVKEYFLQP